MNLPKNLASYDWAWKRGEREGFGPLDDEVSEGQVANRVERAVGRDGRVVQRNIMRVETRKKTAFRWKVRDGYGEDFVRCMEKLRPEYSVNWGAPKCP